MTPPTTQADTPAMEGIACAATPAWLVYKPVQLCPVAASTVVGMDAKTIQVHLFS